MFEEKLSRFGTVVSRLSDMNLEAKPGKCQLSRQRIHYLGHVVTHKRASPDPEKVCAAMKWLRPKTWLVFVVSRVCLATILASWRDVHMSQTPFIVYSREWKRKTRIVRKKEEYALRVTETWGKSGIQPVKPHLWSWNGCWQRPQS